MSLAITELELTDVNTIAIPTDAILMISLLIIFAFLGYSFHNILNTQTNHFIEKVDDTSNLELVKQKLEDQLLPKSSTVNQERLEKPSIKKLNFLPYSKLLGVGSITVLAIGGASLLGIQSMQNSYQGVKTSQVNIKTKDPSKKTFVPMVKLKSLDKATKIIYVDPLFSAINNSANNNLYQFKASKTEDFFSF